MESGKPLTTEQEQKYYTVPAIIYHRWPAKHYIVNQCWKLFELGLKSRICKLINLHVILKNMNSVV